MRAQGSAPAVLTILAIACALAAGCRSGTGTELLERDLKLQENHIYVLEDALEQAECQLASARRENMALKSELSGGDRGAADSPASPLVDMPRARPMPGNGGGSGNTRPTPAGPSRRTEPGASGAPLVEPGIPVEPGEEFNLSVPGEGVGYKPEQPQDRRVARIVLNKQLTGGISHGGHGDSGVLVVFEPRNARGHLVETTGDVSIVVLDPAKQGAEARIARWDYLAEETRPYWRRKPLERGFHFELPWPSTLPDSKRLQLFVRFTTADGRKLLTDMMIDVSAPMERVAASWKAVSEQFSQIKQAVPGGGAESTADPTREPLVLPAGAELAVDERESASRSAKDKEALSKANDAADEDSSGGSLTSGSDDADDHQADDDDREDEPALKQRKKARSQVAADDASSGKRGAKKPQKTARPQWSPYR